MKTRRFSRAAFVLNSGHNASPGWRRSGSPTSASAGRRSTSQPPCSISRPARSSQCHRVIASTMRPCGFIRVVSSERNQSQSFSRAEKLSASTEEATGSSINARSARRPVTAPFIPIPKYSPPCVVVNLVAARESSHRVTPRRTACSSSKPRTPRPKWLARFAVWDAAITASHGLRAIHQAGNNLLAYVLFAAPGGISTIRLVVSPAPNVPARP